MGIGSITSTNSMSATQATAANLKDQKSKNIQNEITNTQQQMRKLSSKEDLSANEKTNKRKELQKEISSLNTELKQYQNELRRSQKREIMMADLLENKELAKEDKPEDRIQSKEASSDSADGKNPLQTKRQGTIVTQNSDGTVILKEALHQDQTSGAVTENRRAGETKEEAIEKEEAKNKDDEAAENTNLSGKEIYSMAAAGSSMQQANRLGTVVAKTRNGIAILKGEIRQDENLGADTVKKQMELEKMEKQEQRAATFLYSVLEEANRADKPAAEPNASAIDKAQAPSENVINALNAFQEEQIPQPKFYVSIS